MSAYRITLFFLSIVLFGCQRSDAPVKTTESAAEVAPILVATLAPASGSTVTGTVTFSPGHEGTVAVRAVVSGLEAGSQHGIHVHEIGDCSAPDASSAGGHFNPDGTPHGAPSNPPELRHAGDLGNITVGAEGGSAEFDAVDSVLTLDSIEGRAVVIHSGPDDFTSQPSGAAGARVACGVIRAENG